jgi:hypothetical protein
MAGRKEAKILKGQIICDEDGRRTVLFAGLDH